jgi:outer membrane protein
MKMKRLIGLVLAILVCSALPAMSAELKIGYIDLQKALTLSEAGKSAKARMGAEAQGYDAPLEARQKDLKKLKEELEKQSLVLSEEARAAKERDYQQKVKEWQRFTKDIQEELQQKEADYIRQILAELETIIKAMGKSEGYTLILEQAENFILYSDERIDLTEKVIKAYDAQYKKAGK